MAVYPLAMPAGPLVQGQQGFDPQYLNYSSPEAGGRIGGVSAGNPLWIGTWSLDRVDLEDGSAVRAFLDRQRDGQRTFLGRDLLRPFPLAYPRGFAGMVRAGGGAFSGAATNWTQAISSEGDATLTLYGLPAGFPLAVGDYIGFKWDAAGAPAGSFTRRTLARAVEAATANGAGTISVLAEPPLPTLTVVPAIAVAHFDEPACVMKLVPGESKAGVTGRGLAQSGLSITAIQELRE